MRINKIIAETSRDSVVEPVFSTPFIELTDADLEEVTGTHGHNYRHYNNCVHHLNCNNCNNCNNCGHHYSCD